MKTKQLDPKVGADMIARGEVVLLNAREVMRWLGPPNDLLASLQSGEVKAFYGPSNEPVLRSDDLLEWMLRHRRRPQGHWH